jgi:hypothetical protein
MSPLPECSRSNAVSSLQVCENRAAQHLGPVGGEAFGVLRMLSGMGERVVELGVGQASRVHRGGQGEEGGVAAGELVQGRSHGGSVARGIGLRQVAVAFAPNPDLLVGKVGGNRGQVDR